MQCYRLYNGRELSVPKAFKSTDSLTTHGQAILREILNPNTYGRTTAPAIEAS